jgi:plasmid stabilization system protein ParE
LRFTVRVRRAAEQELTEAQAWYEAQQPGLGSEFRQAIDGLLEQLRSTPGIHRLFHLDVHRAVLDRFPYLIYFRIDDATVRVLACLHSSRHPKLHRLRISK